MGVKRFTDRHGKERAYYRRKGAPLVAIDPALSGAALAAEIDRLDKLHRPKQAKPGTLRQLVVDYRQHADHWRSLRERTREDYERVFTWLGDAFLDLPLVAIDAAGLAAVRDKARDLHGHKFANQVVTTLRAVFQHGREKGRVRDNPAAGLSRAKPKADAPLPRGNRPCQPWEAVNLLDHAPARLKPAIATALYACLREGDVVALTKAARSGDWLTTVQSKSRRAGKPGRPVTVFIVPDYAAILQAIPENDAVTICVKDNGQPWTQEGLKTAWGRYRDEMLNRGLIESGVTFHGLRHTGPTILEDEGFDETQTRHLLGHGPRSVSGHYGQTASRKQLLRDMALTVERVLREARGNVVRLPANG